MRNIQRCARQAGVPSSRFLPVVALFISGCLTSGLPGAAQVIPPGSYQNSCRSMSVVDGTLLAECQMADQSWRATTLPNAAQCKGEIVNANGKLECRERTSQYQEGYAAAGGKCDDRDGAEYLRIRIAGDPANEIKIVFDKRFKTQIHIFHKKGTMVAWDCGKWPLETQFHYVVLD
jgi:hypothetical protein